MPEVRPTYKSKVLHRDSDNGKWESGRLRVDIVKNKSDLAPLQNKLFTSVFNSVVHAAFVPIVSKIRPQR